MSNLKLFQQENIKQKFAEVLGKQSTSFLVTVSSMISANDMLKDADPQSLLSSAMMAATLKLPVNQNLGFAYILPYSNSVKIVDEKGKDVRVKKIVAQFQLGYKGFIQLAQRSGQYRTISAAPVYEGQMVGFDPLKGYEFDRNNKSSDKIIGYAGYFLLLNGFDKVYYMTVKELQDHGSQYSQSFKKGNGLWKDNFDAMAQKTVLKLLISKFGPMSVDMEKALIADQSVINDVDTLDVDYIDNPPVLNEATNSINPEFLENRKSQIDDCKTSDDLDVLKRQTKPTDPTILSLFETRYDELNKTNIQD